MIYADSEIRGALSGLNQEFSAREASAPAQGYRVVFLEKPLLAGNLISEGGLRSAGPLSGMPQDEELYRNEECAFCIGAAKVDKVFKDGNFTVRSLSHQVLVIPKKHYAHWFAIPIEEQIELFKQAVEIRNEHPSAVSRPIELHCGAAGGQTVFHTHVRTGVY